jgi:hypothetical protein
MSSESDEDREGYEVERDLGFHTKESGEHEIDRARYVRALGILGVKEDYSDEQIL